MNQEQLKAMVGQSAADLIEPDLTSSSVIGVGTGSTANFFIDSLAKIKDKFDGTVASSIASAERLAAHGIPVYELNDVNELLYYVDGADEVSPEFALIKGGGGAHTREKIVASVAQIFVCIVDGSKMVSRLGRFPLPVEVIPMGRSAVARRLVALGGTPVYREGFVTDNGNEILDVHDFDLSDPLASEQRLNNITGVVSCGLFAQSPADIVLAATSSGVERVPVRTSPGERA